MTDSLDILRAAVFDDPEPALSPLMDTLLAAEAATLPSSAAVASAGGAVLFESKTAAAAQSFRGPAMGSQSTGLEVSARLRMAFVPSSMVHLLESRDHPLVTVRLVNGRHTTARFRVTAFVEGYSAHAVDTIEVAAGKEAESSLLPTFFPDRMATLTELTRASLHLLVDDLDGKPEQARTFPIWMLSRTSALLHVTDPATGMPRDLAPYLAAWVTPNVAEVFDVLRRAASSLRDGTIASYQVDAKGVAAQVKALFRALQSAGITYINSVLSFGPLTGVFAQRIRLPRESLAQRSANCIDGTLLFASLLEAASLNPAIVLVPGHAFLAWETSEDSNNWDYLETTLIGSASFEKAVAQGRALAAKYQTLAQLRPSAFRLLSLKSLRAQSIWPME